MSGPSFLGLSDDPPEETSRDSDDLYKTHWGGRIAVVFLVLAIAGGLAYLQWRSGHPLQAASQTAAPQPPTAARVDNTAGDSLSAAAPGANNATNPPAASAQSGNNPEANHQNVGRNSAGGTQPAAGSNQAANPSKTDASNLAPAAAKTANAANAKAAPQTDSIREGHEVAGKPQEDLEEPVRLAESYIQGRGVAQNCNAALGILRNASDRGNPRAEIKLGALYATGNCVAPDRVAAYRHFSRAIAAQPNNVWLEQNRLRLWSDMNAAERQQAMEVEK